MRLPQLIEYPTFKDTTEQFLGYENNFRISDGAWNDMKNMTNDDFPVASTREKRSRQMDSKIGNKLLVFKRNQEGNIGMSELVIKGNDSVELIDGKITTLQRFKTPYDYGYVFCVDGEPFIANLSFLTVVYKKIDENGEYQETKGICYQIRTFSVDNKTYFTLSNKLEFGENFGIVPSSIQATKYGAHKEIDEDGNYYVYCDNPMTESEYIRYFQAVSNYVVLTNINQYITDVLTKQTEYYDYFSKEEIKHSIIRNGAELLVLPEGIVYSSLDTEQPLKRVVEQVDLLPRVIDDKKINFRFRTCIKQNGKYIPLDRGYITTTRAITQKDIDKASPHIISPQEIAAENDKKIKFNGNCYRITNGGLENYIESSKMWASVEGYTQMYYSTQQGTITGNVFGEIKIGDSVEITNLSVSTDTTEASSNLTNTNGFNGVLSFDSEIGAYTKAERVIIESGKWSSGLNYLTILGATYTVVSSDDANDGLIVPYANETVGAIEIKRKFPNVTHFGCSSQNRIWTCSKDGHEIYASALGNLFSWYDFSGISTDSYQVNVASEGEFTGCVNYLGIPLFFKEKTLYTISGSYPTNAGVIDGGSYSVIETSNFNGVEKGSERSLVIINNILYYKSSIGIVAYDGATTHLISSALGNTRYKNAVAGSYKNKYYVSMQNINDGKYYMFVYDTEKGTFCKEDELKVYQFLNYKQGTLMLTGNDIQSLSEEDLLNYDYYKVEDDFNWMVETGTIGYSYPNNKYLSRIQIRMQLQSNSYARLFVQYDSDGNWNRVTELNGKGIKSFTIPIVPKRCDHLKLKLEGKGEIKIVSISKITEEGGDVNVT